MKLFEIYKNQNQTLLEYNQSATLNQWGDRIVQAATFNKQHLSDGWFHQNSSPDNYLDNYIENEELMATAVLKELESIDPTPNKQYVMTLVRWYTAVVKLHDRNKKVYAKLKKAEDQFADDWEDDGDFWPEDYTDLGTGKYTSPGYVTDRATEDWGFEDIDFRISSMGADGTFKLEDADQIRDTLEKFESIKPQLQPNERDIGRFKSFYRFEDFVDVAYDVNYVPPVIDDETLKRKDVEVLYNGPLGTVTVPKSHEASCQLGSGTKWCTATTNNDTWFNSYNKSNDLIIYNEKPGNAKYQFHVKLDGIEARDARDRSIPYTQLSNFANKHPVMSKILKDSKLKAVEKLAHMSFAQAPDGAMGSSLYSKDKVFEILLQYNEKRGGGVIKFLDGFYTSKQSTFGLANAKQLPIQNNAKQLVRYALQRKKPWPEMEQLIIALLQKTLPKVDYSNNTHLKRLENFTKIMDGYANVLNPQWKEYNDIKAEMVAGIRAVQDKSQQ